jgi:hypothetical protein
VEPSALIGRRLGSLHRGRRRFVAFAAASRSDANQGRLVRVAAFRRPRDEDGVLPHLMGTLIPGILIAAWLAYPAIWQRPVLATFAREVLGSRARSSDP